MPEPPPAQLVALLERLGLATAEQVSRMGRRVKRLARDLPGFESVWVDALMQARILTPFQAAEINAGRAESLRLGPYVIEQRLPHPYYVACYRARNADSQESVRLAVIEDPGPRTDTIIQQLEALVGHLKRTDQPLPSPLSPLPSPFIPITHVGVDANRIFAAAAWEGGQTATDWIVHHGRFPSEVVLEIARAMLAELIELKQHGICHSDVNLSSLVFSESGDVVLVLPGLRGILRPEEGYAHADLLPEAYDSLAPERIAAGTPPDTSSDMYACGCVWWHLLCGRPPLAGGNSLGKLRAAQAGAIGDLRRYAPDVSASLASAISACLQREPGRRPESLARLADMLGPPTRGGKEALANCLAHAGRPTVRWTTTVRSIRKSNRTPLWIAGAVCCLAAAVAICWPTWQGLPKGEGGRGKGETTVASGQRPEVVEKNISKFPNFQISKSAASSDSAVVPTSYHQQVETKPADLVLAVDRPLETASLDLREGQCVRGPLGKRATVHVAAPGLVVDKEDVRFENIDFIWRHAATANQTTSEEPALIQLLVSHVEFRGCSFQCEEATHVAVPAIRWMYPSQADATEMALPNGWIRLSDCLLHRVAVGLDCRTVGSLAIKLKNVLHLESGPLVQLDHCPRSDEPMSIVLRQVTLRGGGPMLECFMPSDERRPGEINVLATACAFVPKSGVPLLRLTSDESPESLLNALRWGGQGSLVTPQTPIIAWRALDGSERIIDEASLSIAGLVRSEVGFAAHASGDPAASRLLRWQAPLQSVDPPGVDPSPLPVRGQGPESGNHVPSSSDP